VDIPGTTSTKALHLLLFRLRLFQCGTKYLSETGGNLLKWSDTDDSGCSTGRNPNHPIAADANPLLHFKRDPPREALERPLISHDADGRYGFLAMQDYL
jgi:hypothetical protein